MDRVIRRGKNSNTMNFKSDFLHEFFARGFFAQATHPQELDDSLSSERITAYIGFDCTAKSLHAGSLIQIMILRLLQKYGHKPIVLLGGGTTKIGDPSGKDEARRLNVGLTGRTKGRPGAVMANSPVLSARNWGVRLGIVVGIQQLQCSVARIS